MRRGLPLLPVLFGTSLLLCSCAAADGDSQENGDVLGESEDELSTKSRVYRCSGLTPRIPILSDEVDYLRVTKTKVVWNATKDFHKSAGAQTANLDADYEAKGAVKYRRVRRALGRGVGARGRHARLADRARDAYGRSRNAKR